jgi:hypothetical protein
MKTVLPLFALLSPDGKIFLPSGSSTSDAELMRKDWTTIGTKEK